MGIEEVDYWFDRVIGCGEKGKAALYDEFTTLEKENEKLRIMYAKVQKILLEIKDAPNREAMETDVKSIEIGIVREKPRTRVTKVLSTPDGLVDTVYGLSFKTGEWIEIHEGERCLKEMIEMDKPCK